MIAGKFADGGASAIEARVQIESTAIGPRMTREHARRNEIEMIRELRAGLRKKILEDPVHREDGGARVDRRIADVKFAHLSAASGGLLEYADAKSLMGEIDCCGETAHAGADDRDVMPAVTHRGGVAFSYPTDAGRPLSLDVRLASGGR